MWQFWSTDIGIDIILLPLCRLSLKHHSWRANYHAVIWRRSLQPHNLSPHHPWIDLDTEGSCHKMDLWEEDTKEFGSHPYSKSTDHRGRIGAPIISHEDNNIFWWLDLPQLELNWLFLPFLHCIIKNTSYCFNWCSIWFPNCLLHHFRISGS